MFAAACGLRARDGLQARRALIPIGIGHIASVAILTCAFAQGMSMDRTLVQGLAGTLLVGVALLRLLRGARRRATNGTAASHAGIALWSFLMATSHGTGLMLLPALASICVANNPAREITASGSLVLSLGAVGVHTVAMLVTTGFVAAGVCRGVAMYPRWLSGKGPRRAWTAALAVTGVLLIVLR
jgi:hypothetical protein